MSKIPSGPDLTGAYLGWDGVAGDAIYLVTPGQKQWIMSPAVLDKFYFAANQVRVTPAPWLSMLHTGDPLS